MDTTRLSITVWRRIYLPWEDDADEPELKSEEAEHVAFSDIAEDDEEDPIEAAAAFLSGSRNLCSVCFAAVEASASGSLDCIDARTWYASEPYVDPYSGETEELTAHLRGITDAEARTIYVKVFGKPAA
jgi:hypothetical protein